MSATAELERLLGIMARLRDPQDGCPWDLEQNFSTIAPYTIEEAYEVADAIQRGDMADLKSELGDLLFQVVFHARMAEEAGHFGFDDVADVISLGGDKLAQGEERGAHEHAGGDVTPEQKGDGKQRGHDPPGADPGDQVFDRGLPFFRVQPPA